MQKIKLNLMHTLHIISLLPRLSPWPVQRHITFSCNI